MSQADAEHSFDGYREAYLFFKEEQMLPRREVNTLTINTQLCTIYLENCILSLRSKKEEPYEFLFRT